MKRVVSLFFCLVAPLCAENLFTNGNLDTAGGWKGSKKITEEPENGKPNRMLVVTAKKKDQVSFSQEVDTKDKLSLTVTFRYRTKNYVGRGLELRGIRMNSGFTFSNRELIADGQWHEMTWEFTQVQGSRKIDFVIAVLQGDGEIFFDDFCAQANE